MPGTVSPRRLVSVTPQEGLFSLRIAASASEHGLEIAQVVAICPVLDPAQTMEALDCGPLAYRLHFIRKWRRSLRRKKAAFPALYDFSNLERFKSLRQMTDFFVRHYTEFPNLETYLSGYSLHGSRLAELRVPAKLLLVDDDPVIPIRGLQKIVRSRSMQIDRSRYGGHCGLIAGYGLGSWLDEYVLDALDLTRGNRCGVSL